MTSVTSNPEFKVTPVLSQSCLWVGSTRGLGWVEYEKSTRFFDDYTTYHCKGQCKLNTRGVWTIGVFRTISRFISKTVKYTVVVTMEDHALTADSFTVSCVGLDWVGSDRVGSGHRKWTPGQLCTRRL